MKYFILILTLILSIIFPTYTFSDIKLIAKLQSGGNIVFIRHAIAPGNGDPDIIDLNDCKTQRNLSLEGINQSKKIGIFFALNSFYDDKFYKFKERQIKDLRQYIKRWHGNKNLVFITHYVVISEMLNIGASSGEIVISNKNYEVLGKIETN